MERLTYVKHPRSWGRGKHPTKYTSRHTFQEVVARLAAYEDTGLEPEDIDALRKREQGLAELLVQVSCGCAVSYTRLTELAQAEKDGRLVVLPCKPGTEIFTHCHIKNAQPIAHGYFYPPYIPMLGKDAWLTREEAEAALKQMEGRKQ